MRAGVGNGVSKDLQEGLTAYAEGQADIQKSLREHFCMLWKLPFVGNDDSANDKGGERSDDDDDIDGDEEGDGSDTEGEDAEDEEEDEF